MSKMNGQFFYSILGYISLCAFVLMTVRKIPFLKRLVLGDMK